MDSGCTAGNSSLMNCTMEDWLPDENTTTVGVGPISRSFVRAQTAYDYIRAVLYWVIFAVGFPGNILVLAVVVWKLVKSPQHQAMTILVGSLAFSDLGTQTFVTLFSGLLSINAEWIYGEVACRMYVFWRMLTPDCSACTLMLISVDRLLGLKKMGGGYFTTRKAMMLVVGLWIVNIVINIPNFIWADIVTTRRARHDCKVSNVDERVNVVYTAAKTVVAFFIPLTISWIAYCSIIVKTRKSLQTVTATGSNNSMSTRLIATCLTIAISFTLCWVPIRIASFLRNLTDLASPGKLMIWLAVLIAFNSSINPIVYGLMWRPFRDALRDMYKSYCRGGRCSRANQVSAT